MIFCFIKYSNMEIYAIGNEFSTILGDDYLKVGYIFF